MPLVCSCRIMLIGTMNLYEQYIANGMRLPFWVKRRTWGATCARITSVEGLHGDAARAFGAAVRADIFDFSGELKEADVLLSSPGSRTIWQRIPPLRVHEGTSLSSSVALHPV